MIYPDGKTFVEVKGKRYCIHPFYDVLSKRREQQKSLRTHYQYKNFTPIKKSRKGSKNHNVEIEIKRYSEKNKQNDEKPKYNSPNCPRGRQSIWVEFTYG